MKRLVLALWLPDEPGRPYAQIEPRQMEPALVRAGFSAVDARRAIEALIRALDQEARTV